MAKVTTWIWTVTGMSTVQLPDPNYVVLANWTLIGTDGVYKSSISSSTQFSVINPDPNFVPYNNLTNDIVVGWIQSVLGPDMVASYQATVQGQIDSQANPPVVPQPTPLPWSA